MNKILDGYNNEFLFVLEFNNKKVKELNPLLREVIDDIFPKINEDAIIKSWKNHVYNQKGDIFIKIGSSIRCISIKKGSRNSVHVESISDFRKFLSSINVSEEIINSYFLFHYGIDKYNNKKILSSKEYSELNSNEIEKINESFSKVDMNRVVNRFIIRGNKSLYDINGIIYGTPQDFFWISKKDIMNIIADSIGIQSKGIHFGCLFVQPLNRCINNNELYINRRNFIQIKWYSMFDDIIWYKNSQILKN